MKYWRISKFSTGHIMATATPENTLCYPERRLYFSVGAFKRDFGDDAYISDRETWYIPLDIDQG